VTELPLIVVLTSESDPEFSIPPPSAALPFAMVRPVILTTARFPTVKIRKSGVPGLLLRATVSYDGPRPVITIRVERAGRGLVKRIVPIAEGANLIVSGEG
jgi:hypothetical protein